MFNDPLKSAETVSLDETVIAPQVTSIEKEVVVEIKSTELETIMPEKQPSIVPPRPKAPLVRMPRPIMMPHVKSEVP